LPYYFHGKVVEPSPQYSLSTVPLLPLATPSRRAGLDSLSPVTSLRRDHTRLPRPARLVLRHRATLPNRFRLRSDAENDAVDTCALFGQPTTLATSRPTLADIVRFGTTPSVASTAMRSSLFQTSHAKLSCTRMSFGSINARGTPVNLHSKIIRT